MKITLEIIRRVLKEALGFDSFAASFISSVHEDPTIRTACINKEGKLLYNQDFVNQHISCKEDLFSLIFHELLHPMFGHFIYANGEMEKISADAIINAAISTIYSRESAEGNLFKKLYLAKGLQGILRPGSRMSRSRYKRVYEKLYPSWHEKEDAMTTGELIQSLKILTPKETFAKVFLLGAHGTHGTQDGSAPEKNWAGMPQDVLSRIAEEYKRSISERAGKQAGFSTILLDMVIKALRTHLSIKRVLLQKFATKRKLDRFKELTHARRTTASPIPLSISKRDVVLLSAGVNPVYFHNQLQQPRHLDRGLAIYLDVSGSVNEYLPKILGILTNLKTEIKTIFQFSNEVVETSFEELLKGSIKTTHGTDFSCIARSILERGFDRAIIITDGYASMDENLMEELKKRGLVTLTILFDDAQSCEDFEIFGDVVHLEDICT